MAYLIVNAQVWDGENDQRYPADVLIERNRIAAVARSQGEMRPDGIETIDGAGMTLMPGMVEGGADHVMPPRLPKDLPPPARASASPGASARLKAAMAANMNEARRIGPLGCVSIAWIWVAGGAADRGIDTGRLSLPRHGGYADALLNLQFKPPSQQHVARVSL